MCLIFIFTFAFCAPSLFADHCCGVVPQDRLSVCYHVFDPFIFVYLFIYLYFLLYICICQPSVFANHCFGVVPHDWLSVCFREHTFAYIHNLAQEHRLSGWFVHGSFFPWGFPKSHFNPSLMVLPTVCV